MCAGQAVVVCAGQAVVVGMCDPMQAVYSSEEGVVRVSWQPVEVAGSDAVEYTVSGWKDGAGDPANLYRYAAPPLPPLPSLPFPPLAL